MIQARTDGGLCASDGVVVVVQYGHEVGACEDDAEFVRDLRSISLSWQLAVVDCGACFAVE